jgi:hypothetical protein
MFKFDPVEFVFTCTKESDSPAEVKNNVVVYYRKFRKDYEPVGRAEAQSPTELSEINATLCFALLSPTYDSKKHPSTKSPNPQTSVTVTSIYNP